MNLKQKLKKSIFIILIVFFLLPLSISADGGAIRPSPDGDWTWVDEYSQQAFINYENGVEKLIIAVDLEEGNSDIAWIIPVPSNPEKVELDITSELPIFYGDDIISKAKLSFSDSLKISYGMSFFGQVWTLPVSPVLLVSLSGGARSGGFGETTPGDPAVISSHIEKAGMVSEVITAKDSQAIYNYFSQRGFNIEPGNITELDFYIEKDYSFVISWINPKSASNKGERGIFVSFPVSKIYYPLILTSAYGEAEIPVTIRVVGHVKPEIYPEIKPYTEVSYFTERTKSSGGARGRRCIADMNQIRSEMQIYELEHGSYPSSLEELLENDSDIKALVEDISNMCDAYPSYSSKHSADYTMRVGLSSGIYEVNSSLFSGLIDEIDRKDLLSPELQKFYGNSRAWAGEAEYTKININAPAKSFKRDLWMEEGKPLKISLALWATKNFLAVIVIFYLLITGILSFVAGGITGLICFRKFKKYALIGLANIATLVCLIFVYNHSKNKQPEEIKYSRLSFDFTFSIIFILLLAIIPLIMIFFTDLTIAVAATIAVLLWLAAILGIFTFIRFVLNKIGWKNRVARFSLGIVLFIGFLVPLGIIMSLLLLLLA